MRQKQQYFKSWKKLLESHSFKEKGMRKRITINFKRNFFFILIFLPVLTSIGYTLAGCRQESAWKPGKPLPKEKIKIGVIHPNKIDSNSIYDYAHYSGTVEMQQKIGLKDSQIIRKVNVFDGDRATAKVAMRDCIKEGANVIIAASWGYMDPCEKLAREFPSVIFAHATGTKHNNSNFTNYTTRNYHARYLSGIVAGLRTKTNKIGFVAAWGKENSEVTSGINAFAIGVERVNRHASIHVQITYSWYDPMGETNAANALIAAGCDVIAAHCNTPSPQITAQKAGLWAIGYNSDMSADAPNAVITSVVLNWGALYTKLVESIINGTFSPEPHYYGLAEEAVDITPLSEKLAAPGTNVQIEKEKLRIIKGDFNVFDGVLKTNDGRTVGEAGKTLTDETILSGINWYYHNVTEK